MKVHSLNWTMVVVMMVDRISIQCFLWQWNIFHFITKRRPMQMAFSHFLSFFRLFSMNENRKEIYIYTLAHIFQIHLLHHRWHLYPLWWSRFLIFFLSLYKPRKRKLRTKIIVKFRRKLKLQYMFCVCVCTHNFALFLESKDHIQVWITYTAYNINDVWVKKSSRKITNVSIFFSFAF